MVVRRWVRGRAVVYPCGAWHVLALGRCLGSGCRRAGQTTKWVLAADGALGGSEGVGTRARPLALPLAMGCLWAPGSSLCVHARVCVCAGVCACAMCVHVCACMHCVYACVHMCMRVCTCVCAHACTHVCRGVGGWVGGHPSSYLTSCVVKGYG